MFIDLKRSTPLIAHAVQGDLLSRTERITVYDDGQPYDLTGAHVIIRYRKPDGTVGAYDALEDDRPAFVISGNTVTITWAEQALSVPGNVSVTVSIYRGEAVLNSWPLTLRVAPNAAPDSVVESVDYVSNELMRRATDAVERAEQLAATAAHPPQPRDGVWYVWDGTEYAPTDQPSRGEQGLQGIRGERGERGLQGIRGERGEQGIQGEPGTPGVQMHFDAAAETLHITGVTT